MRNARNPAPPRDVDPNQAPGGQNKPRREGGRAGGHSTGDRNASPKRHPGHVTNRS